MKMKTSIAALVTLLLAGAASASDAAGSRFATDQYLRAGMENIRVEVVSRAGAIHAGSLAPRQYRKLGAVVEQNVASIVANCKLPEAADAELHGVLAEIIAGATDMQDKSAESRAAGVVRVGRALNTYAERFDDPSFAPVTMHVHVAGRMVEAKL